MPKYALIHLDSNVWGEMPLRHGREPWDWSQMSLVSHWVVILRHDRLRKIVLLPNEYWDMLKRHINLRTSFCSLPGSFLRKDALAQLPAAACAWRADWQAIWTSSQVALGFALAARNACLVGALIRPVGTGWSNPVHRQPLLCSLQSGWHRAFCARGTPRWRTGRRKVDFCRSRRCGNRHSRSVWLIFV